MINSIKHTRVQNFVSNRQYWQSPFLVWLPNVTDNYGYRVHPIRGDKDYHMGIDIAMPEGTVIYAAQAGTVTFADNSGGYGLVVVIDDGAGLVSKYAHCSALLVSAGQTVNAGDPIAKVGSTGSSTGNHLHMELIKDGKYLNPLFFALTNDFGELPEYGGNPGVAYDDATFQKIMDEATKHIGRAYVWGGSSPSTGFDCSGFVCWVYRVSGVYDMGRITALGIYSHCARVTDPKPGDLVFFERTYSTTSPITHVGIYVGGGKMLHCGDPIGYADLSSNYWRSHFVAYGRLPIN